MPWARSTAAASMLSSPPEKSPRARMVLVMVNRALRRLYGKVSCRVASKLVAQASRLCKRRLNGHEPLVAYPRR